MAKTIIQNQNFRRGTETDVKEYIFNMMMPNAKTAALGDMIAWLPSIIYVAENYDYVRGHLIVPSYFLEVAQNVMSKYPHWRVYHKVPDRFASGYPMKRPLEHPINATGMHLVDLGFLYFLGIVPPPEGARNYPLLDLEDVELPSLSHNYAVMTPGATAVTRKMLPNVFNEICEWLNKAGITPVFLGDAKMVGRKIEFDERYDLSLGVNLIGRTSLLEAAKIMQNSKCVIGIDNGLLHLAGMTDATIIFGYTVAGPNQRQIPRIYGHTIELFADKKELPCLFCQESVRFFMDHHFTNCIYKENEPKCIKALNAESFCAAITSVIKE